VVDALLVAVFLAALVASLGMPDWVPAMWGWGALYAFVTLLFGGDPRRASATERARTEPFVRDGLQARDAYRAWRGTEDPAA
jgi:hypothetical protein